MALQFDEDEERANNLLLDFMSWTQDHGLNCNGDEQARAIHTLQLFVFQHALQRTGGICGTWYNGFKEAT